MGLENRGNFTEIWLPVRVFVKIGDTPTFLLKPHMRFCADLQRSCVMFVEGQNCNSWNNRFYFDGS